MDDFKFSIDVLDRDIKIEGIDGGVHRIYFRNIGTIAMIRKMIEDLRIYAKYHDR